MAYTWNHDRASDHIAKKITDVRDVEIVDYKRDLALENIPTNKAYRVPAVHQYVDILNIDEMLDVTNVEGVTCHRETLRFLNLHYRASARVLEKCGARRVDFHNQRLHAVITKPYGTEEEPARIHKAVAMAQLNIDVLKRTGEGSNIPSAKVRVGIDSGVSLVVNNGRSGGREPLFLGNPANQAAKLSGGGQGAGIFLWNNAREAIGLSAVKNPKATALTADEVKLCQEAAALGVTADEVVADWEADLAKNPISSFEFSGHTPPLRTLDIASLTPSNSRRQKAVSIYADLDGFTAYVARLLDENPEAAVKVLHVVRAELDRVLTSEFGGRRIRFIGDCIHGLLCEGTAQTTDPLATMSTSTLCVGGLRSSFDLALELLGDEGIDVEGLGLQIGFDYGPMTVTRLGLHGDRVRCSISRGVLQSEAEQARCGPAETAIGQTAYDAASDGVRDLFGETRKVANLDYNEAVEALREKKDTVAKAAHAVAFAGATPSVARATNSIVRPYACGH